MHKFGAHAATDVTGFGLLGHAQNLAEYQRECLQFVINKIPVIKNVLSFGKILNLDAKIRAGKSVETSGGLLISIPAEFSENFCQEFKEVTNGKHLAWIVGSVRMSQRREAVLSDDVEVFDVNLPM